MSYAENYKLIDFSKEIVIERKARQAPARSDLPVPYVVSDHMEPVQHPCTGEFFTSKRMFREVTKAHGCIEVGNDPARLRPRPKPKPDRKAIRKSIQKAFEMHASGVRP